MGLYRDIHKTDIDTDSSNILIITATETETKAFHEVMVGNISRITCGDYTYYLGQVGLYNIIHVQCLQMGSLSPGGSNQTTNVALQEWPQIKAVIMVGICFGVDEKSQQIGDVIVSSSIRNYETRRVGGEMGLGSIAPFLRPARYGIGFSIGSLTIKTFPSMKSISKVRTFSELS